MGWPPSHHTHSGGVARKPHLVFGCNNYSKNKGYNNTLLGVLFVCVVVREPPLFACIIAMLCSNTMFVITLFALPPACVKVAKRITTRFRVEPLLVIVVVWLGRTGYALGRYGASGGCVFLCPLRRGGGGPQLPLTSGAQIITLILIRLSWRARVIVSQSKTRKSSLQVLVQSSYHNEECPLWARPSLKGRPTLHADSDGLCEFWQTGELGVEACVQHYNEELHRICDSRHSCGR